MNRTGGGAMDQISDVEKTCSFGIEERLDRIESSLAELCKSLARHNEAIGGGSAFTFTPSSLPESPEVAICDNDNRRSTRPPLPDPRLLRRIIRQRQLRTRYFDSDLFGDPAWDMLLDLAVARAEYTRVSVTSLCIASGVPPTTALRWISEMTKMGLLQRSEDETDRRRAFVTLTDKASDALARYFAEIGPTAIDLI
jgi:DNA-binding MarR family transcriptional regulator